MKITTVISIILILIFGFLLRVYNPLWDGGYHLHPDERAIVLFVLPLQFPTSLAQFFSIQSPWNPHFFAYGSLPIYLLKIMGGVVAHFNPLASGYDGITILGRVLSAVFDTGTILLVFFMTKKLFTSRIALLASFVYMASVLPIQLSHFYAVDVPLTFFMTLTIFLSLLFFERPSFLRAVYLGSALGLAIATKISASVLLVSIGFVFLVQIITLFKHEKKLQFQVSPRSLILYLFATICAAGLIFVICEPYAIIDFMSFINQTQQQGAMTQSAFTFPYTLQFVGSKPYVSELSFIGIWGLGILGSAFALLGLFDITRDTYIKEKNLMRILQVSLVFLFTLTYFAIVGKFAVAWIRYMLPLYPFFAIMAGVGISRAVTDLPRRLHSWALGIILIGLLIWPLSFIHIYAVPHTRVTASLWMNAHIPEGATIAVEHWDDSLPLFGQEKYRTQTLELYNPDTSEKWIKINQQLAESDYIVLSSNRLYVPLQKLTNCSILPPEHCYPITAQYYNDLFAGRRGFTEVATFEVDPTIPLLNIPIHDQSADESFTVYDHPKVIIFKKTP